MSTAKDLTPEEVEAYAKGLRPVDEWMAWANPQPKIVSQADRIEQKVDALTALVQHLVDSLAGDDDGDDPPAKTLDGDLDSGARDQSQAL